MSRRRIEIPPALLMSTLIDANGFVERAARQLGVGRLTVMRRLRERGLEQRARELREATGWKFGRPQ
jgi:transcriptional regulator of acetoin/glycerol metabolism